MPQMRDSRGRFASNRKGWRKWVAYLPWAGLVTLGVVWGWRAVPVSPGTMQANVGAAIAAADQEDKPDAPALESLSTPVSPTPTPNEVQVLATSVAELRAELAVGQVQAASSQPVMVTVPVTAAVVVSESSSTTTQSMASIELTVTKVITQGVWAVIYFPGATQQMLKWQFRNPDPISWPAFPNDPLGNLPALMEYGKTIDEFCQQGQTCDVIVSAMHYRIISGDYNIPGVGEQCKAGQKGAGCAIMLVNVGDVTASFRNQSIDAGWTVTGRYWDGSKMPDTIWAGLSHTGYNMLNLAGNQVNPGANCGSPAGCPKVLLTFVVISGNEVLMKGTSIVSR